MYWRKNMSHELDFSKGYAAIAYAGETPWHGFGNPILPTDDIDQIRIKAGLDYEVVERPIFYGVSTDQGNKAKTIDNRKALLRGDNQDFLSIVSNNYKTVQPSEVLGFFNDLVGLQGLTINVAGALDHGRKVWALAHIDDDFRLYGQDEIKPYVLVATSYDGTMSTTAMMTTVRVVCNNTMRFSGAYSADGSANDVFKVKHNATFEVDAAHGKLGLREDAWLAHKEQMDNLARFQVSPEDIMEYFYMVAGQGDDIVRNEDNGSVISLPEPKRTVKALTHSYLKGPGSTLRSSQGTMWGALNAVTHYQDHVAPAADRGARFDSATFGGGNVRKQKALELAMDMIGEEVQAA
jgi:phage/plasmid-like protein (TIGR03299 family)